MNRIRTPRLVLAGLVTLLAFIVIELIWEAGIGPLLFGDISAVVRGLPMKSGWSLRNEALNLTIALVNCFMLIWLYASLRPMFGVGTRTALIASSFVLAFVFAFELNYANLGYFGLDLVLLDALNLIVELPLALIIGAQIYESGRWAIPEA